jgi:hypothetical protein
MAIDRTPWNALVDDDGSNLTGTIWNKDKIKTVLLDPVDSFVGNGGTFSTYTPTWNGADGVAPVLGNGTLTGRYMLIGKWMELAIVLQLGSTSTVGTSSYWMLTLPPVTPAAVGQRNTFRAGVMSAAGAVQGGWMAYALSATLIYSAGPAGSLWGPSTPFAWTAGSIFSVRGAIEIQ